VKAIALRLNGRAFVLDTESFATVRLSDSEWQLGEYQDEVSASPKDCRSREVAAARDRIAERLDRERGQSFVTSKINDFPEWKAQVIINLNLSTRCNLACRYCYAESRVRKAPVRSMTISTLETCLRNLLKNSEYDGMHIRISLVGSAEPLGNMAFIRAVPELLSQLTLETGRKVTIEGLVTNGTLLTEETLRLFEQLGVEPVLSIDGPPNVHDALRPYISGAGTYADIMARVGPYIAAKRISRSIATLTGQFNDYVSIFRHLEGLGFTEIMMKPVRLPRGHELAAEDSYQRMIYGFAAMLEFLLTEIDNSRWSTLEHLSSYDFLLINLYYTRTNRHRLRCCNGGWYEIGIDVDGAMYPCPTFIGEPKAQIGVCGEFDQQALTDFRSSTLMQYRVACRTCWCREICGGGCYFTAFAASGSPAGVDPARCEFTRHIAKLSLWFWSEVCRRNLGNVKKCEKALRI